MILSSLMAGRLPIRQTSPVISAIYKNALHVASYGYSEQVFWYGCP